MAPPPTEAERKADNSDRHLHDQHHAHKPEATRPEAQEFWEITLSLILAEPELETAEAIENQ
jgi:hypothetical protein